MPNKVVSSPSFLAKTMSHDATRIFNFAKTSPLFRALNIVPSAEDWQRHGTSLAQQLSPNSTELSDVLSDPVIASRIYHLYLPIYFWCREIVLKARKKEPRRAVGIGISAPQGCGKTTLVTFLTGCFQTDGLVCSAVSFDDFYLTGLEQDTLAAKHASNPLLQVRGNAGTHDIPLGTNTLHSLLQREQHVAIPRYDKSARNGRGDRCNQTDWSVQTECSDVVLLEGWMAGFAPVEKKDNENDNNNINEINANMGQYSEWHDQMNSWVVVSIEDCNQVFQWRLEAEQAMKASGKDGMTDEQVHDFVSCYMPAYKSFLPGLYAAGNGNGVGSKPTLMVNVDENRQVKEGRSPSNM